MDDLKINSSPINPNQDTTYDEDMEPIQDLSPISNNTDLNSSSMIAEINNHITIDNLIDNNDQNNDDHKDNENDNHKDNENDNHKDNENDNHKENNDQKDDEINIQDFEPALFHLPSLIRMQEQFNHYKLSILRDICKQKKMNFSIANFKIKRELSSY